MQKLMNSIELYQSKQNELNQDADTEIEEVERVKIKKIEKVVFNPIVHHKISDGSEVLRIENEDDFTRIDFIYYPRPYYIDGGWVSISSKSFIRPVDTNDKLTLLKAINIPIAPTKHYFRNVNEFLCYTLIFPPLPKNTKYIDIIESESAGADWFNFYGVEMNRITRKRLEVGN